MKCRTCRHWDPPDFWERYDDQSGVSSKCRKPLPVILDSDYTYGEWPVTYATDKCSYYFPVFWVLIALPITRMYYFLTDKVLMVKWWWKARKYNKMGTLPKGGVSMEEVSKIWSTIYPDLLKGLQQPAWLTMWEIPKSQEDQDARIRVSMPEVRSNYDEVVSPE